MASSRGISPEFAYTVGTGRLFMDMAQFHKDSEALLERPVLTHEFALEDTWDEMKARLEAHFRFIVGEDGAMR